MAAVVLDLSAEKALIFRITHIENVLWIFDNGFRCAASDCLDPNFRVIGNTELISKRATQPVPFIHGTTLSDFIPFYFTPRSPMLLNIKTGWEGVRQQPMQDIVVVVTSLHKLTATGVRFLFTNRHASLRGARPSDRLDQLDRIDWDILRRSDFKRFTDDPSKKDR